MLKSSFRFSLLTIILGVGIIACNNDNYTPKPRGYFRINFPEKIYRQLDSIYPYKFEYPEYVKITPDRQALHETNWINLDFHTFRGKVHLSYKRVANTELLNRYTEDARTLALKHIPKASSIEQQLIAVPEHKVYGLIYNIRGLGAASPYQFYVTDSTSHFLRGALYFDAVPNADSLMPVIDFVKKDIDHLMQTIEWK